MIRNLGPEQKCLRLNLRLGFSLIELLVVVLIIGVLAAVALPQYQAAVEKSRLSEGFVLARAVRDAEQAYYLANGAYTSDFTALDFGLPAGWEVDGATARYGNKSIMLAVAAESNTAANSVYVYINNSTGIEFYFSGARELCFSSSEVGKKACKSMGGAEYFTSGSTVWYHVS